MMTLMKTAIAICTAMLLATACRSIDPLANADVGMSYEDFVHTFGSPTIEETTNIGAKGAPPNPRAADPNFFMPPNAEYGMAEFRHDDGSIIVVYFVPAQQYEKLTSRKCSLDDGDVVLNILLLDSNGVVQNIPGRVPVLDDDPIWSEPQGSEGADIP